jgi:phosphoribosyl-ATP pyrophosphohydrolase
MNSSDTLERLDAVIESRKPAHGGDPEKSYVARLLSKGPDSFLKKIGEEATEVVMAAKDLEHASTNDDLRKAFVGEMADLWFHSMIALSHFGLSTQEVLQELSRREGLSGLDEKALRKAMQRDA